MAQEHNYFAPLANEDDDDVLKLINRVKEGEKKNSSAVEKVHNEKNEEEKMGHSVPTDMRAKRLSLPSHGDDGAESGKKSSEGDDGAKSEKKSKKKNKKVVSQDIVEKKENLMTLEEYEKKKLEDRKSLEAFKRLEQRKVEDKDFESMQLIEKKKEDSQLLKSEDKLKKKDYIKEKDRKTLSISEFLKPAKGETPYLQQWRRPYRQRPNKHDGRRADGQGDGGRPDGRGDGVLHSAPLAPPSSPSFELDDLEFPTLGGNEKA